MIYQRLVKRAHLKKRMMSTLLIVKIKKMARKVRIS